MANKRPHELFKTKSLNDRLILIFFFTDDLYYRWNQRLQSVQSGYPQKLASTFLECTKGTFLDERDKSPGSSGIGITPSIFCMVIAFLVHLIASL